MRILTFDIGGTAIKAGVINEKGEILEKKEMATLAKEGGNALMNRVLEAIGEYKDIDRVGVSTRGQVDIENGIVVFDTDEIPGWSGMEIKKIIQERYSLPTVVENDVNAAALGEAYYGAGKNSSSFLCLTYGTGVGGAIVEKGEVYHGAFGYAGEFGHMITHANGNKCSCGRNGCYESYASTSALISIVKSKLLISGNIDGKTIFEKVVMGNSQYKEIVDTWIDEIVVGVANVIHIFNPPLVILGGGVMKQTYIIDSINKKISSYVLPGFRKVVIKPAYLENDAGILGASIMALKLGV